LTEERPDVLRIGYFGSYARGDWGVGSDLDLIVIVDHGADSFERRGLLFDVSFSPVSVDLLVYTQAEWERMKDAENRFVRTVENEAT
jgi:predicted nucleotidyltransferase